MTGRYDAIVVGSGLGGLTAGALYARAGHKVLVLERNENFGGAATVYRHGALAIEASLHEIDGLDAHDAKGPILRALGLDRDIAFVDVGALFEVRSPLLGEPFVLPHGLAAADPLDLAAVGLNGFFQFGEVVFVLDPEAEQVEPGARVVAEPDRVVVLLVPALEVHGVVAALGQLQPEDLGVVGRGQLEVGGTDVDVGKTQDSHGASRGW